MLYNVKKLSFLLQGGTCWLKSLNISNATYGASQSVAYLENRVTTTPNSKGACGFLQISWQDYGEGKEYGWSQNCDFPGQDLANVKSIGKRCEELCKAKDGCTHFTWNKFEVGPFTFN